MPELPEVETVRQQLRRGVVGKTIKAVEVFHSKSVANDETIEDKLIGKTIADIDRIGKLMIFSFVGEVDLFLLAHFKMTGQFFVVVGNDVSGGGHSMTAADIRQLPGRHTRVAYYFTDNTILYFNDMRLFGYTKLANAALVAITRAGFGPELIDPTFDDTWFYEKLKKRKTPIKATLLNQAFVSGLGNIYVDEALWRASIKPTRLANTMSQKEAAALRIAARDVMLESIKIGGTTFQSFADAEGNAGNFTQYLNVFGKQGIACSRCGETIIKIRCAGRGTHYCPGCQK
ncbi:MAG: DNA-formamidopyrimidine glycosylase [Parcubacteria group bacterium CG2_30_44_11]|nr:MAG: DNA-formamidopyrimidine glycosylase [Parcubacteria group bacterium CG2_30_44_11]